MSAHLIVFNLNSTLADAGPRYAKAFCFVCEEFGLDAPKPPAVEAALGEMNLIQIMAKFAPTLSQSAHNHFMQACNRTRDALLEEPGYREPLYDDLVETLDQLVKRGVSLGLCTNIGKTAIDAQLTHYGLDDFFPKRMRRGKIDATLTSTHQVKSQAMHYLAEQHVEQGGRAAPMISIGDSIADYAASTLNGFRFIGFARDESTQSKMRQAGISHMFSAYSQLLPLLESLLGMEFLQPRPRTSTSALSLSAAGSS